MIICIHCKIHIVKKELIRNKDLEILNCASIARGEHIVEKPRELSCGHLICHGCVRYKLLNNCNNYELKCGICDTVNTNTKS